MKTLSKVNSFVIVLLLTGCFSNKEDNILKMGKYYFNDKKCAHDYIILRENGTYEHSVANDRIKYKKMGKWRENKNENSIVLYNYQSLYRITGYNCEFIDTTGRIGGSIQYHYSYGTLTLGDETQYTHQSVYER